MTKTRELDLASWMLGVGLILGSLGTMRLGAAWGVAFGGFYLALPLARTVVRAYRTGRRRTYIAGEDLRGGPVYVGRDGRVYQATANGRIREMAVTPVEPTT